MSQYKLFIVPEALGEIKALPGNLRQRVRRIIDELVLSPFPPASKKLQGDIPRELYRIRIERWRIIYALDHDAMTIDVLAIVKRPPFDYKDLMQLVTRLN